MGTDISLFAERLVSRNWHPVPEPETDGPSGRTIPSEAFFDMGRPYGLFSLLSGRPLGMRSGLVGLTPVFTPRGLPDDMNPLYQEVLIDWYTPGPDGGDWGASWLGLSELTGLNWDQKLRHHAYVEEQYARCFRPDEAFPAEFPETGTLYHGLLGPPPAGTVQVSWSITLRDYVGCSSWFIDQLSALAAGEELRIIYWFNS